MAFEIDVNVSGTPPAFIAVVALPSVEYVRRDPGGSVLHQIVRDHFATFRAEAAHVRGGEGLPRFVEKEFQAFLRCGWLAGVLSVPHGIRYLLAWDHDLCKAVVGVLLREVSWHMRDRARARGLVDPRGGAVAVVCSGLAGRSI